nr:RNA-directed DNA polymerase, eukaryota [Tanacetum cinerariifolium]
MDCISHMDVKFIWGNSNYQFVASDSVGNSGGILCVWEDSIFKKDNVSVFDNFIALYGTWIPTIAKVLIVVIYDPQSPSLKRYLWDYLSGLISSWKGETIVMGDFNVVRFEGERFGSTFNQANARVFNHFISSSGLIEVKMEGYAFTWSHPSATKMSKLDRFLFSKGIVSTFPDITAVCLDCHLSDHRPILLNEITSDFGPSRFRMLIRFKKKLQDLKKVIRIWIRDYNSSQLGAKRAIIDELVSIDKDLDNGVMSDKMLLNRIELSCKLHELKQSDLKDIAQKAKIKWAIEGDENSKFFHNIINKRRSQLSVRGVFVNGDWRTASSLVKDSFLDHFASRFKQPDSARFKLNIPLHKQLSSDQSGILDMNISSDKIRAAVWDCGENKSPGPDGYTFEFFRRYWNLIGSDFCYADDCFFESGFYSDQREPNSRVPIFCGLKQGDPLAPLLFNLVMESLHFSVSRAVIDGIFKGLRLNGSLSISHLFYADDVVFIGEWSDANLINLIRILNCFHLASGLKIR